MGGLFTANLSSDSLVPPKRRHTSRLGDGAQFAIQYGQRVGRHITLKAGIGFSNREYSLVKYKVGDILSSIFIFDSPLHTDSFPIARVQYKLNYLDLSLSVAFEKGGEGRVVQAKCGLMARLQFLTHKQAIITPDDAPAISVPTNIALAEKAYTENVNAFVISFSPYCDVSFRVYKGVHVYYRLAPFSVYASSLDHRITTGQAEYVSNGVGISYQF